MTTGAPKPFLAHKEQLDLLRSRGLTIHDAPKALLTLREISYYKLSAYSLTLRTDDVFHEGMSCLNAKSREAWQW